MAKKAIYKDLAKYYDLIYSWKEYKHEAQTIKSIIKKYKKSAGKDLLEVACGTGKHIQYFKDTFTVVGTDLNKDMLVAAKKNCPDVSFLRADMVSLSLKKKFDVILCLFSSIGYLKNYKNLNKTIKNFSQHLNKGGVVIIEPWFTEQAYSVGLPSMTIYDGDDVKIARLCVSKRRGIISILDMHYLVSERDEDTKHFVERHELAMFDIEKTQKIMRQHGLSVKFIKPNSLNDRGLYVGIKI